MNSRRYIVAAVAVVMAAVLIALALAPIGSEEAPEATAAAGERQRIFAFHNPIGLNLHHFLFWQAHPHGRQSGDVADWPASLAGEDRRKVDEALYYYRRTFEDQDLLFSPALSEIKIRLAEHDGSSSFADLGLEAWHQRVLEPVLPIYRRHLWPSHEAANRRWIERATRDLERYGEAAMVRLTTAYQDDFPPTPIRLDAVVEGHWAGAYTTTEPLHVVITSTREDYQGKNALEMLFHEASHGILGPRRGTAMDHLGDAFEARGERLRRDLQQADQELLSSPELSAIKTQLAKVDGLVELADLDLEAWYTAVLEQMLPICRRHLWPSDEAEDPLWIDRRTRDVELYGKTVVKNEREMVLPEEASDDIPGPPRGTAIDHLGDAFEADGERRRRDLWHALLFYTTGEVLRQFYRDEGLGSYQPYAHRNGLWNGKWEKFLPGLEQDWQLYLDGRASMDEAARALADRLAG